MMQASIGDRIEPPQRKRRTQQKLDKFKRNEKTYSTNKTYKAQKTPKMPETIDLALKSTLWWACAKVKAFGGRRELSF